MTNKVCMYVVCTIELKEISIPITIIVVVGVFVYRRRLAPGKPSYISSTCPALLIVISLASPDKFVSIQFNPTSARVDTPPRQ